MRNLMIAATLLTAVCANAQEEKKYPEQQPMEAGMTEYWTPQRKVVTPGDFKMNTAPSDAIVLFDGKNLDAWTNDDGGKAEWIVKNGVMTVNPGKGSIRTKQKFGSYQLHLEWCIPVGMEGQSQGRGNSGVFMQNRYEVQILDCYNNETYINGMTGSIYKQTPPLVNAMRPQGQWQVYDIIYTAPIFKEDGTYLYHPYITVIQNGVVLQNHTEIQGTTEYIGLPKVSAHGEDVISIQDHGNPISFRNIWIRPM